MIKEINSIELNEYLDKNDKMIVVDCYAPWCRYCTMLEPIFNEISNELKNDISFLKINTDNNVEFSQEYEIMSLPTILIIKDGKVINRKSGVISADELRNMIENKN